MGDVRTPSSWNMRHMTNSSPVSGGELFAAASPSSAVPRQRSLLPLTLLILVTIALLVAWLSRERWWPVPEVSVVRALPLAGASTGPRSSSTEPQQWLPASGWMVAWPHMVSASAQVSGTVQELLIQPGQQVRKGEVLARLDPRAAQLRLDQALAEEAAALAVVASSRHTIALEEAALRQLRAEYSQAQYRHDAVELQLQRVEAGGTSVSDARRQDLSLEMAAAQAAVEAAGAALAQAEARRSIAQAGHSRALAEHEARHSHMRQRSWEVEEHSVRSPIDGVVADVLVQPGQWLHSDEEHDGASVALVYEPQQLAAVVDVPLSSVADIRDGAAARIRCDVLPDTELVAQVHSRHGQADRSRGTLRLYLTLEQPAPSALTPEMLIRARIAVGNAQAIDSSQDEATTSNDDLTTIPPLEAADHPDFMWWKVDTEHRLRQVAVEIIERHEQHWLVRGLKAGDLIVHDHWPQARSGLRVNPHPMQQP
ncbi:MAG: HlyD family efflux transporter periplasmic adaptor subunit [Planctomycetota bacterium]|nr:MAG: HlyD family efflux transporter periplasmic adaptor subunit [Planctomycetota bacterium]